MSNAIPQVAGLSNALAALENKTQASIDQLRADLNSATLTPGTPATGNASTGISETEFVIRNDDVDQDSAIISRIRGNDSDERVGIPNMYTIAHLKQYVSKEEYDTITAFYHSADIYKKSE